MTQDNDPETYVYVAILISIGFQRFKERSMHFLVKLSFFRYFPEQRRAKGDNKSQLNFAKRLDFFTSNREQVSGFEGTEIQTNVFSTNSEGVVLSHFYKLGSKGVCIRS